MTEAGTIALGLTACKQWIVTDSERAMLCYAMLYNIVPVRKPWTCGEQGQNGIIQSHKKRQGKVKDTC